MSVCVCVYIISVCIVHMYIISEYRPPSCVLSVAHFRLETLSPNQAHSYTWRRFCCSTYPTEGFLSVDRHVPGALTRLRALNSTVQWVATMQLANGSLGIPMTPGGERATRTASLLQWATLRLAEDSVATQAQASLTRWVDYITSAEGALETGVNIYALPTSFVGLAVADLVQPWVTWTPE